jgi:hypothetical protein
MGLLQQMELMWVEPPVNILIIKKFFDVDITQCTKEIGQWLQAR